MHLPLPRVSYKPELGAPSGRASRPRPRRPLPAVLAAVALLTLTTAPRVAVTLGTPSTRADSEPAQQTELVRNGDFELASFSGWSVEGQPPVRLARVPRSGGRSTVAQLGGADDARQVLSQVVSVPDLPGASARVHFWVNLFGTEQAEATDQFCAALATADHARRLVDLGCLDGVQAVASTMDAGGWLEVDYRLSGEEWNAVHGQAVSVTFELRTNDRQPTSLLLDDVSFQVAADGRSGDRFEPNDAREDATRLASGQRQSGLTIDPDGDVDMFALDAKAGDTVVVDVDAAADGSPLDAVAELQDGTGRSMCYSDDDESSVDPYLRCRIPADGRYDVVVRTYDGHGRPDFSYAITLQTANQDTAAPGPGTPVPPTPGPGTPAATVTPTPGTPTGTPFPSLPPPAPTPTAERSAGRRAWTAILYLDGDNSLCGGYPPLVARMERELAGRIGPGGFLNVAALLDRDPRSCGPSSGATRYLLQPGGRYVDGQNRWELGELNMGDPQTLVGFAQWAMQSYPAQHYYLAIDNHGGGVAGIAWDQTSGNDQLTNAELYGALKAITANGGRRIDLLAYEACLMGTFENAYDVRRFADYLLAFETLSWTSTASYPAYLGDPRFTPATSGSELGEIMIDVYHKSVTTNPYGVALIEAGKMDGLLAAVTRWANALDEHMDVAHPALTSAREGAQRIDANSDNVLTTEDEYLDLYDLAEQTAARGLAAAEAADVQRAVAGAVVRLEHRPRPGEPAVPNLDYRRTHGLGIYWPQRPSGWYDQYVRHQVYTATRDGTWGDFLESYFSSDGARVRRGLPVDPGPATRRPAGVVPRLVLPLAMVKHAVRW